MIVKRALTIKCLVLSLFIHFSPWMAAQPRPGAPTLSGSLELPSEDSHLPPPSGCQAPLSHLVAVAAIEGGWEMEAMIDYYRSRLTSPQGPGFGLD